MSNDQILAQLDANALVAIRIITALFIAIFVAVSFVFAVTIAVFVAGWLVSRQVLLFILTCKHTQYAYAMLGASL